MSYPEFPPPSAAIPPPGVAAPPEVPSHNDTQTRTNVVALQNLAGQQLPMTQKESLSARMWRVLRDVPGNVLIGIVAPLLSLDFRKGRTALNLWAFNGYGPRYALTIIELALKDGSDRLSIFNRTLETAPPLDCFGGKLKHLQLVECGLTCWPDLKCVPLLESLDLCRNQLYLHDGIYLPENLQHLNLSRNKLTSLPEQMKFPNSLTHLDLSENSLPTVLEKLESLPNLTELDLSKTEMTNLSANINLHTNLSVLNLSGNQLTNERFPPLDSLHALSKIDLSYNPGITELPFDLDSMPNLEEINITGTAIPHERAVAIQEECTSRRRMLGQAAIKNPQLAEWLRGAEEITRQLIETTFKDFKIFNLTERKVIYDWLDRLKSTIDYTSNRQIMKKVVLQIMETAINDRKFKKILLERAPTQDPDACMDRTATEFNEIYTLWRMHILPENTSLVEKLKTIVGCAKTTIFRETLDRLIADYEETLNEGRDPTLTPIIYHESTEVYLYFETTLKQRLGLISFMENMAHSVIGNVSWISSEDLVREVKAKYDAEYLDRLLDNGVFMAIVEEDPDFKAMWAKKDAEEDFAGQMEKLDESSETDDVSDRGEKEQDRELQKQAEMGDLMTARQNALKEQIRLWLTEKLHANQSQA
ncbi:MAG: NEL-type E3 ubiquitin ligase domain-containing protein [Parachlamydiaceae bacterium]